MHAQRVSAATLALILGVTLLLAAPATAAVGAWDAPVAVSVAGQSGSNVDLATDGTTITAVWRGSNGVNSLIQSARSTDSGATWSTPVYLSVEGLNARAPRVVTDGSRVTAIWQQSADPHSLIVTASSVDGGPWSAPVTLSELGENAKDPLLVTDGTTVTAIWQRFDGANDRVQTASSTNGGAWSTPANLSAASSSGREPDLATDGTTITVVWSRFEGGVDQVQTVYSTNDGISWSSPVVLNTGGERGRDPRVVTDGSRITVVWSRTSGDRVVESASSINGGVTWSVPVNLYVAGGFIEAAIPRVVTDGTTITAVWRIFDGTNNRIQTVSSSDGGVTWSAPVFISEGGQQATFPNIVTDGSTITATWFWSADDPDFPPRVQVSSSINGGITWSTPITLSVVTERAIDPRLVTDGTTVTVAWTNTDDGGSGVKASSFTVEAPAEPELAESGANNVLTFGALAAVLLLAGGLLLARVTHRETSPARR